MHVRGFTMHASVQGDTQRHLCWNCGGNWIICRKSASRRWNCSLFMNLDETPEEVNTKTSADIAATAGENGGELPGYQVLNYWGYREGFYYAPKAAYAAEEDAALEFRQLVKEFHKRRMEVILQFYFPKGMDVTEIGNILRFWVLTYHVDGFHLMGDVPAQALAGDPALTDTKLWYYDFECSEALRSGTEAGVSESCGIPGRLSVHHA